MIFLIAIGALAAVAAAKKNSASAVAPPSQTGNLTSTASNPNLVPTRVHRNAVGSSLSNALGNASLPPSFYISGNPGTTGVTLPPSSSINYYRPKHVSVRFIPSVSNPRGGNKTIPLAVAGSPTISQNNPPKPVHAITTSRLGKRKITYSALVNPTQSSREVINPENPGNFWTTRRVKRGG